MFIYLLLLLFQEPTKVDLVAQGIQGVNQNGRILLVGTVTNIGGKAYAGSRIAKLYHQVTPASPWILLHFESVPYLSSRQSFTIKEFEPKGANNLTKYLLVITGQDSNPSNDIIIVPRTSVTVIKSE